VKEGVAMPAVTVEESVVLPKIAPVDRATATERPVKSVTKAPSGFEGEGFPVRRAFAGISLADLDPFILMDQMGEVEYAPGEPKGTPWHPHRGFETVTYIIDGTFRHRDSTGGGGLITNGDTQWMTAGAGILHIEAPPEELVASGGFFHGIQLWVNLPAKEKWVDPRYQDIGRDAVTLLRSDDGGALVRIVSGEVGGHAGPGRTHTPVNLLHATVAPGARLEVPWDPRSNALVYVLAGNGSVGTGRTPIGTGELAVFGAGDYFVVDADAVQDSRSKALELFVLGGRPIGEPVAHYGPFVMNTADELEQAFDDFRRGKMGVIPTA
jgi:redox-sensitive bicupin YhaK (pirin superfamily)